MKELQVPEFIKNEKGGRTYKTPDGLVIEVSGSALDRMCGINVYFTVKESEDE